MNGHGHAHCRHVDIYDACVEIDPHAGFKLRPFHTTGILAQLSLGFNLLRFFVRSYGYENLGHGLLTLSCFLWLNFVMKHFSLHTAHIVYVLHIWVSKCY